MVNKNILGYKETKFFNASQINAEDFYEQERYTAKIKQAQERHDLASKINTIVFHVHEKLRGKTHSIIRTQTNSMVEKFLNCVSISRGKCYI